MLDNIDPDPLTPEVLVPPSWVSVPSTDSDGTFSLSWNSVSTPNVLYILEEATQSDFSDATAVFSGTGTSTTRSNKAAGMWYYRVKTRLTGYATSAAATAAPNGCDVKGLIAPAWVSVAATDSDGTYGVSWASVSTPSADYILEEATQSDFSDAVAVYSGTGTSTTRSNKAAGMWYYRVKLRLAGFGSSSYTEAGAPCDVKGLVAPAWVSVPANSSGNIGISWQTVSTPGIIYDLEEATQSDFSDATGIYSGNSTSRTISRGVGTYYYRVKTRLSGFGSSPYTDAPNNCSVN